MPQRCAPLFCGWIISKAYWSWRLGPQNEGGSRWVMACLNRRRLFPWVFWSKKGTLCWPWDANLGAMDTSPSFRRKDSQLPNQGFLTPRPAFPSRGNFPLQGLLCSEAQKWGQQEDSHFSLLLSYTWRCPGVKPTHLHSPKGALGLTVSKTLFLWVTPHNIPPAGWAVASWGTALFTPPHIPGECCCCSSSSHLPTLIA